MSWLLDTNVVSEWVKPYSNPGVRAWLDRTDEDTLFLSVVTLAELRRGVERLPAGARKSRLDAWVADELPLRFEHRIISVDAAVANAWGRLMAQSQSRGVTMGFIDAFLAATAEVHGLTVVTRDVRGFEALGLSVLNPWSDG